MRRVEREAELSAEAERELRALDDALAGRPVDAELEGVARLARELRAERPEPAVELVERLDGRVEIGFAASPDDRPVDAGGARSRERRRRSSWAPRLAGLGAAAAVALAIVIGVAVLQSAGTTGGDDSASSGGDAGTASLDASSADDGGAAAEAGVGEASSANAGVASGRPKTDLAPGRDNRKVESAADVTLSTEPDRVREVSDDVVDVADDNSAIVLSSNVRERPDGVSIGRLELAVPSGQLSGFLAEISDLADVESRTDSTLDITDEFASTRERLRETEAERDGLLEQLADPADAAEAESLRQRLRIVRNRLERQRARLANLDQRADLARVSVTVNGNGSDSGGWTLGDAVRDSLDVLRALAGAAIVAAAALVPLGLLLWIGWLLSRGARRRARERALDEA